MSALELPDAELDRTVGTRWDPSAALDAFDQRDPDQVGIVTESRVQGVRQSRAQLARQFGVRMVESLTKC